MKIKINKKHLTLIITAILLLALPVGLYLVGQTQVFKPKAFQPRGSVALQLSSDKNSTIPLPAGTPIDVNLQVDSGDFNKISAIDIKVKYNDKLTLNSFESDNQSGLDRTILSSFDTNAKIYHLITVNTSGNISASGLINLGKLKFTAAKDGQAMVEIVDEPILTAAGQENKLTLARTDRPNLPAVFASILFTIGNPVSPTLTATPSGTITPTATPTATITPIVVPPSCIDGNIGDNNCVDSADFAEWFKEFTGLSRDVNSRGELKADFWPYCQLGRRGDGVINGADLNVWLREIGGNNKCR